MYPIQIELFVLVLVGILGLLFGSFLNVCIYRVPRKESIVTGNSHCTACGEEIKRYDLIPVISYLILGGRCRSCKAKISARYPLVEALNTACWLLIYVTYGLTFESLIYCFFVSALIVAAIIDIDTMEVPPALTIFILILGVGALFILKDVPFYERLIGFAAASILLLIVALLSKGGMGGGDIKLMAVCGLVMGCKLILLALFLAVILGAAFGVFLLATKKKGRKSEMPLVPFLSFGMFFCLLFGNQLLTSYLSLFGV